VLFDIVGFVERLKERFWRDVRAAFSWLLAGGDDRLEHSGVHWKLFGGSDGYLAKPGWSAIKLRV